MEYIIRPCEEKDIPSLVVLCKNHATYEEASYTIEGKAELLTAALFADTPKVFCFVIESEAKLVGYFTYTFDFSTWDARTFYILTAFTSNPTLEASVLENAWLSR